MADDWCFKDIAPELSATVPTAAQVAKGIPVPPIRLLEIMSPDDWEIFTEEWLSFHKAAGEYDAIRRYSGPGDLGLDVVAFSAAGGFAEPWDSYQCKHYDHALSPEDVCAEVGKLIYHSFNKTPPFNQNCRVPRKHVFVSPRGAGITVARWFKDPQRFKKEIKERWKKQCAPNIGKGIEAPLEGDLLAYVEVFDFSIFGDKTGAELIEEHSQTVFYAPRFGGGCLRAATLQSRRRIRPNMKAFISEKFSMPTENGWARLFSRPLTLPLTRNCPATTIASASYSTAPRSYGILRATARHREHSLRCKMISLMASLMFARATTPQD